MTLRTHIAKTETEGRWHTGTRETVRPSTQRGGTSHVAVFTTTTVTDDHPMAVIDAKSGRSYDLEDQKPTSVVK